jgi:hypothetical protein
MALSKKRPATSGPTFFGFGLNGSYTSPLGALFRPLVTQSYTISADMLGSHSTIDPEGTTRRRGGLDDYAFAFTHTGPAPFDNAIAGVDSLPRSRVKRSGSSLDTDTASTPSSSATAPRLPILESSMGLLSPIGLTTDTPPLVRTSPADRPSGSTMSPACTTPSQAPSLAPLFIAQLDFDHPLLSSSTIGLGLHLADTQPDATTIGDRRNLSPEPETSSHRSSQVAEMGVVPSIPGHASSLSEVEVCVPVLKQSLQSPFTGTAGSLAPRTKLIRRVTPPRTEPGDLVPAVSIRRPRLSNSSTYSSNSQVVAEVMMAEHASRSTAQLKRPTKPVRSASDGHMPKRASFADVCKLNRPREYPRRLV